MSNKRRRHGHRHDAVRMFNIGPVSALCLEIPMAWVGSLELLYRLEDGRVRAIDRHHGPLRVLKAHHPEGPGLAEHVLVHPPGGLAGGDDLSVRVEVGAGAHARLSTPSATRFYRSLGEVARQDIELTIGAGAALEWLPLETLLHGQCRARSRLRARLAPGALFMGWDMVCLGLPASGDDFRSGSFEQDLEIEGMWVEAIRLEAQDQTLRRSPVGLNGRPVWGTLWSQNSSKQVRAVLPLFAFIRGRASLRLWLIHLRESTLRKARCLSCPEVTAPFPR